jgi:cell division septation protein DedD
MDKALKQRLVGASVLIILAVIVLPMLLSGRSDRLKHESSQIELPPKPEELSIETRRFPVGIPNKPTPDVLPESLETEEVIDPETLQTEVPELTTTLTDSPVPVDQVEGENDSGALTATDTEELAGTESVETTAPEVNAIKAPEVTTITLTSKKPESLVLPETPQVSEGTPRYLVQVASFSNEKNANALAGLLKAENLPVLMDVVDRPAGRMYRVRVGPFAERSEADALVVSLGTKMTDLTPRVLDLRPKDSAPVSKPSDPLVRWVVQVGSFSQSKSAEDLVARLRLAGLSAFSEKVTSATGTAYKVRIGPELDRDKAAELARKVKVEHKLDGFVTTQE